jgi:hypothetical protein
MTLREFAENVAGAVVVLIGMWAFLSLLFALVPGNGQ